MSGEARALITPAPTEQEAAAIVAAIAHHRAAAASWTPPAEVAGGWLRAARLEAVARGQALAVAWGGGARSG